MEYKWVALSNTTIGVLMASLDSNIVLIALPTIGRELPGTSLFDLMWILLGYQLVISSVLVNFGRLADMFGRVKLFNIGFVIFTVFSLFCSLSQNGTQLVTFRMLQGVGAAFLFANSAAILTDAFPAEERGKALGINQVSIVAGSAIGLVLGGFLTASTGWQSIFWVNIPIGIFATLWSHSRLRESATIRSSHHVDIAGNITFACGLALVLAGMTLHVIASLQSGESYLIVISGILLIALFLLIETKAKEPMLDLSLFRIKLFTAGNVAIFLNALARGAVSLVLVFYLQGPTMSLDPLAAGLFLLPISASLAFWGPISGWLSDKYGVRPLTTLGLIVSSLGFLMLSGIGPTISFPQLAVPLILVGSGMGIFAAPNRASIMNSVRSDVRGVASAISVTLNNTGMTFSLALAFLIMTTSTPVADLQRIFLGVSESTNAPWIGSFIGSIQSVYYLSTIILLIAIVPSAMRGVTGSAKAPEKVLAGEPEGE